MSANLSIENFAEAGGVGVDVVVDHVVPLYLLQKPPFLRKQLRVLLKEPCPPEWREREKTREAREGNGYVRGMGRRKRWGGKEGGEQGQHLRVKPDYPLAR